MPRNARNSGGIDISLEDDTAPRRAPVSRDGTGTGIDIPLDGLHTPRSGNCGAGGITDAELDIVNRHHAEFKELHRRAREQNRG